MSKATEEPTGFITVYTDVANSRSDAQETSRYEAVIACEAIRASLGASVVKVLDAGDRAYVIFNGSNYPECGIVP